jgi:hypothetical protein
MTMTAQRNSAQALSRPSSGTYQLVTMGAPFPFRGLSFMIWKMGREGEGQEQWVVKIQLSIGVHGDWLQDP